MIYLNILHKKDPNKRSTWFGKVVDPCSAGHTGAFTAQNTTFQRSTDLISLTANIW